MDRLSDLETGDRAALGGEQRFRRRLQAEVGRLRQFVKAGEPLRLRVAAPEQEAAARAAIAKVQQDYDRPVVTTIEPLATWYPAEDYHQEYVVKDGGRNPYCRVIVEPKLAKFRKGYADRLKSSAGAEAR